MSNPIDQIDAMLALCARYRDRAELPGLPPRSLMDDPTDEARAAMQAFERASAQRRVIEREYEAASRTGWEATLRALKVAVPIIEAEIDKRKRDILSLRTMGRGTDLAESTAADLELDLERLEQALARIAKGLEGVQ